MMATDMNDLHTARGALNKLAGDRLAVGLPVGPDLSTALRAVERVIDANGGE